MQLEELKMSVKLDTRKLEKAMKRLEKQSIKLSKALDNFYQTYRLVKNLEEIEIEVVENKLAKEQRLKLFDNEIVLKKQELAELFVSKKALKCCKNMEEVEKLLNGEKENER